MSGDHAKKEMVTGEKPATSHGKAPSRESGNKKKEGSPSRIRTHKSGEKKKKMKKWSTTRPTLHRPLHRDLMPCPSLLSAKSARSIVRSPYAIIAFLNILHYFRSH
jgi:hypothetical protein